MDDNQFLQDDPISYFKSNIQTETQPASSTIFLGVPKSTPITLWLLFCIALGTYFLFATFIGNIVLMPMSIEGSSMYPTLNQEYTTTGNNYANDVVYLKKTTAVEYKDIIVFNSTPYTTNQTSDPTYFIKRVIAVGGDTLQFVKINENTTTQLTTYHVIKNGVALDEDYALEEIIYNTTNTPNIIATESIITIPEGYVFVMGDNRNNSKDSRDLGIIKTEDILGKVVIHIPFGSSIITGLIKSIQNDYLF